ncbi:HNH endonuclease [Rhodoblastus acidophilus]|uniref:HNH endonuclease n=1 Tax=Rhodoblastus acidophilus TaxID=1074 RepID=UPI003CD04EDC
MARDYSYDTKYESSPEQKKARASRNRARRLMIKEHGKAALKGKDVDHSDGNPRNNSRRNLHITSVHYNRAKH